MTTKPALAALFALFVFASSLPENQDISTVVPEIQAVEAANSAPQRPWCERGVPNEPESVQATSSDTLPATCDTCQTHEECKDHCDALFRCQGYSWRPDGQPRCEFHTFVSFAVGPPAEGFPQDGSTVEWYANNRAVGCAPVKINWCGRGTDTDPAGYKTNDGSEDEDKSWLGCDRDECPDMATCKAKCESQWQCMGFNLMIDTYQPKGCYLKTVASFKEGAPFPGGAVRYSGPFYANERAPGCGVTDGTKLCWCGHGAPTGVQSYRDSSCQPAECPDMNACKKKCKYDPECMGVEWNQNSASPARCFMRKVTGFTERADYHTPFYANERAPGCREIC